MREHLQDCPDCAALCQRVYEEAAQMRDAIQRVPVPYRLMERLLTQWTLLRVDEEA